jgi:hypothetical protein
MGKTVFRYNCLQLSNLTSIQITYLTVLAYPKIEMWGGYLDSGKGLMPATSPQHPSLTVLQIITGFS